MADMTSTIRITGTIGGRKITHEHTYTMTDVYDAGSFDMGSARLSPDLGSDGDTTVSFTQDCPSYLFAVNRSTAHMGTLRLTPTGAAKEMSLLLLPGQFVVLNEYTNGVGLMNTTATPSTTTMLEIEAVQFDTVPAIGKLIQGATLAAYQAIS